MSELWIFDCDGVLLNSNDAKVEAFSRAFGTYGDECVQEVLAHHRSNQGHSRFDLVDFLFVAVLRRSPEPGERESLLMSIGHECRRALAEVEVDPAATQLLDLLRLRNARVFVASGGEEAEVRWALSHHDLSGFFEGIYGSPRPKEAVVRHLMQQLQPSAGFMVGDSPSDVLVAKSHGLVALVVSHWSAVQPAAWLDLHPAADRVLTDLDSVYRLLEGS